MSDRFRLAALCCVAFLFVAVPAHAEDRLSREVAAYRAAIGASDTTRCRGSVAETFSRAIAVSDALLAHDGDEAVMEALSKKRFDALATSLRGIVLNREEVVIAKPDPVFFLRLAKRCGGIEDVAFFEEYSATYPDRVWPSYIAQQTDVTGCSTLGEGELLARFSGWSDYARKYPRSYRSSVRAELARIEEELTTGTCICGTAAEAVQELSRFVRRFPRATIAPQVRRRMEAIRSGATELRQHCTSG
ncbi:MAG: hypothetical protein M3Q69_10945 [Acidobacteriota bacterium]|nr:hypothetical protein [Acidobacteriota bacterium]